MRERGGGGCKGRGRAEQKGLKKEGEKDAGSEAAEAERVKDGVGQDAAGEEEEEEAAEMSATRVRRIAEAETDFTRSSHFLHLIQICGAKVHVVSITARFSSPFFRFQLPPDG